MSPLNTSPSCMAMLSGMLASSVAANSELRIRPDFISTRVASCTRSSVTRKYPFASATILICVSRPLRKLSAIGSPSALTSALT